MARHDEDEELLPGTRRLLDNTARNRPSAEAGPGGGGVGHDSETESLTKHGDIVLVPQPTSSPNDPLNWSIARKIWHSALACYVVILTAATSNVAGSAAVGVNEEYGISYDVFNTGAGVLFIGIGYWTLLGFDTAMRVRNALWRPPFVMYYRTFRLGDVGRLEQCERAAQGRARGVHRVGEVHDLDAHLRELALQPEALLGAAPVVALEEVGEAHVAPRVHLRRRRLDVDVVDERDVLDDLRTLRRRDDGLDALHLTQHLVADDARDQNVAVLLGVTKKVEMPDVKQVESSDGIADTRPHDLPRSVIPQ